MEICIGARYHSQTELSKIYHDISISFRKYYYSILFTGSDTAVAEHLQRFYFFYVYFKKESNLKH